MSSPSTGPYQSRLFNFLNRQSQRLQDRSVRVARHVKMATVWGVQIVLYPIYLIFQTARLAGHQLQQAAKKTWLQMQASKLSQRETPPASDMPIQRVLNIVDTEVSPNTPNLPLLVSEQSITEKADIALIRTNSAVLSPENSKRDASPLSKTPESVLAGSGVVSESETQIAEASEIPLHRRKVICGIACLLTTRSLVLVSVDNEILDILTPQQQQKIIQRISLEIADYWRSRKLADRFSKQFTGRLQIPESERSRILPPVRLFWLVMAWIQNSPVAIAANLFQESTLIITQESGFSSQNFHPTFQQELPAYPTLPEPLTGTPTPRAYFQTFSESLSILDRTVADLEAHPLQPVSELTTAISDRTQGLLQRLQAKVRQPIPANSPQPPATTDTKETDTFKIHSLIRAAIDYFFGSRSSHLPKNSDPTQQAMPGDVPRKRNPLSGKKSASFHPQLTAAEEEDPWLTWGDIFPDDSTKRHRESVNKSEVRNIAGSPVASVPGTITPPTPNADLKHTPDWIETHATPAGYVKHPLERLLELLDRAMVWLEQAIVKIWQLISNR